MVCVNELTLREVDGLIIHPRKTNLAP